MKGKKIFMFCPPEGPVPVAGNEKRAAMSIVKQISSIIGKGKIISLWVSDKVVATEAGRSMKTILIENLKVDGYKYDNKFYADVVNRPEFDWLIEEFNNFHGENIIIIANSEYIVCFAEKMNFVMECHLDGRFGPGPLEGLFINNGVFSDFSFRKE